MGRPGAPAAPRDWPARGGKRERRRSAWQPSRPPRLLLLLQLVGFFFALLADRAVGVELLRLVVGLERLLLVFGGVVLAQIVVGRREVGVELQRRVVVGQRARVVTEAVAAHAAPHVQVGLVFDLERLIERG